MCNASYVKFLQLSPHGYKLFVPQKQAVFYADKMIIGKPQSKSVGQECFYLKMVITTLHQYLIVLGNDKWLRPPSM